MAARGAMDVELEEYVVCRDLGGGTGQVLFRGWQEEVTEYVTHALDEGEITPKDIQEGKIYVDTVRDFAAKADYVISH